MVVVVIIGILAAIAVPNYMAIRNRARESCIKENMHTLQTTVEDFNLRADGIYPGDLGTTIIQANPAYTGPEPDIAVAVAMKPPYTDLSIIGDNVINPFSPTNSAMMDGLPALGAAPVGIMGYQASNTPTDDPLNGIPWNEVGSGAAMMYRITGLGMKGIIMVMSQVGVK